jgi:hypothetical protein
MAGIFRHFFLCLRLTSDEIFISTGNLNLIIQVAEESAPISSKSTNITKILFSALSFSFA